MKVTIVGGGTAGWLSALFLIQYNKQNPTNTIDISLIESPDIPIIGAGEGSTGLLTNTLSLLSKDIKELNELDFIKKSNATYKLGIEFVDWKYPGHNFFNPIEVISPFNQILFTKFNSTLESTKSEILWKNYLSPISKNSKNYNNYSYHFDAHKVGEYFKEIAIKNGVRHILDNVINTSYTSSKTLESIDLQNLKTYTSDFWIDCSGFKQILINPTKDNWIKYSEYLPTNTAITYHTKYKENENIKPSTLSKAMPNGWVWQIPTLERYGCGYVYSNNFIDEDKAFQELQFQTQQKINNYKVVKFNPGRVKEVWKQNVLAIGLSSSFLEPLEATSIHTTLVQLIDFMQNKFSWDKNKLLSPKNIKSYNDFFSTLVDEFRDLVQLHYIVNREDTSFWKFIKYDIKLGENLKQILSICKDRVPTFTDFPSHFGAGGWGVWGWTLKGLGYISPSNINNALNIHDKFFLKNQYNSQKDINYSNIKNFVKNKEIIKFVKNK